MNNLLCLATEHGVIIAERDRSGWREIQHSLIDQVATSIIAREGVILAGTKNGIFRSDDVGRTWNAASAGLTQRHVRWLAYHPDISDREFAGTEPAGLFVSHDGAQTWCECPEVAQLRDRHQWMLPYSPEAGCVRGFAFHGDRAYAAVEVGGVLRSDDGGETWRLVDGSDGNPDLDGPPEPFVYPDVHSISVHPSSPDLVFGPTGGGFYRSDDGGRTWTLLYDCYCRAAWIDPLDARHIVLSPADGVERNGRIEESSDGGFTWHAASAGLFVPWPHHMVERFEQIDSELWAVLSNGKLLTAPFDTLQWQLVLPDVKSINAVTAFPDA
ncbi:MAG TPA: hypothetical protein VMP08_01530 [Anaerolineae bacterium]|nr:hypothetical protein [Anaerolineae bacterium]